MNKEEIRRTENAINTLLESLKDASDSHSQGGLLIVIAGGIAQLCSQVLHLQIQLQEVIDRESPR